MRGRFLKWGLLVGAICIAAGLMSFGLKRQGMVSLDESIYVFSAMTDRQILLWMLDGKRGDIVERLKKSPYPVENEAWAKPLWHMAAVGATLVFGPTVDSLAYGNVFWAVVATFFFLLLSYRFFSGRIRPVLLAFCLLILSPVFIYFCRVRLAHALHYAVFLPAVWLYLRSLSRRGIWLCFGCGLLLGASFTTHGSSLPFIGIIVGFEVLSSIIRNREWRLALYRSGVLMLGLVVPLLLCQVVTSTFIRLSGQAVNEYRNKLVDRTQKRYEIRHPNMDYFDQLRFNMRIVARPFKRSALPGVSPSSAGWLIKLDSYIYRPWVYEGSVRLCLVLLGVFVCFWLFRRRWFGYMRRRLPEDSGEPELLILLLFVVPYLFYFFSSVHSGAIRSLLLCWPFGALLGAWLGDKVLDRLPAKYVVAIVTVFLGLTFWNLAPMYSCQSGFREVGRWLRARGENGVAFLATGNAGMNQLRAERLRVYLVGSASELTASKGARYLVVSRRDSFFHPPPDNWQNRLADRLQREASPVLKTEFRPLPQAYDFFRRGRDDVLDSIGRWLFGRGVKRNPIRVYVYRLSIAVLLKAPGVGQKNRRR